MVTEALEANEALVRKGEVTTFFVSISNYTLFVRADDRVEKELIPVAGDLYDSLKTFFYDIEEIEYNTQDYTNLKSLIHARRMLNRILNQE